MSVYSQCLLLWARLAAAGFYSCSFHSSRACCELSGRTFITFQKGGCLWGARRLTAGRPRLCLRCRKLGQEGPESRRVAGEAAPSPLVNDKKACSRSSCQTCALPISFQTRLQRCSSSPQPGDRHSEEGPSVHQEVGLYQTLNL